MSMRELDKSATPVNSAPMTRREARERASKPMRSSRPRSAPRPKPARRAASKLLSLGAMLFAAALMIGMSVPSNAFLSDASAAAPDVVSHKVPGQSLAVSADAAIAETPRDAFGVISWAEQLRLRYANINYSFTATTGAIRWPFPYSVNITDGFGLRDASISGRAQHNGVDFVPGAGAPIYAVADGTVIVHDDDQYGYGNNVVISHDVLGLVFDSQYSHMQTGSSPLKVGDVVKAGDFIGLVGDTGNATGPHLHFEIHLGGVPVDPFAFLKANAVN
jgi:murein DD-endopeptidase MepM/ murein hydrolase activator NlpD